MMTLSTWPHRIFRYSITSSARASSVTVYSKINLTTDHGGHLV
jgi:hypothetical protein